MTDKMLLEQKIKDLGLKKSFIASSLGITYQAFRNKLIGASDFTGPEINKMCEILHITKLTEKEAIFFAKE